jgi:alpha-1,3-mannosyltransferase
MEEVVRNLVKFQQTRSRYQPTVITLDRVFREPNRVLPPMDVLDDIPVRRLSYRGSERYPLCPQVLGAVRDFDLVHVHGIDFFFDFLAVTRPLHRKPLIASTHGGFFHTKFAQGLKQVFFTTVTRTSALAYQRVIATSNNDADIFRQVVNERTLRTIENGVDIDKFDDASSTTLQPTLIYFGRWSVNKGLLETLDVLAALCTLQPHTPWQLIIAGREYDLNADAILRHAAVLGIVDRITIATNPSNAELSALISKASYFICMSRHEGFGIAPVEGMSAGLIPILSEIPPFVQLIDTSGVGLTLVSRKSPIEQAQQIADLHALQENLDIGENTRRVTARMRAAFYSWTGVAASYVDQYDQVMATR